MYLLYISQYGLLALLVFHIKCAFGVHEGGRLEEALSNLA
jgi:hypothetical protein